MPSNKANNLKTIVFNFPEVRVVEASAGSGKTFTLAKRYIQLLFKPQLNQDQIPIRNILAITFTNKAAFEMKSRILEFLKLTALGKLSKDQEAELLQSIGLDQAKASVKAYAVMEDLIHHYNYFQVQTIDKFINALLSGCAFRLNLTANFRIRTNSDEYLQVSLDKLVDDASRSKHLTRMFDNFLHNYLYLENRTGWFPKEDMLFIIYTLFSQYNAYGRAFKISPISSEDIFKKKAFILEEMNKLRLLLPEQTDQRFVNSLDKFLNEHKNSFDIDQLSDYFSREVVPVKKNTQVSKELEKLWEEIQWHIKHLCEDEALSLFNPYVEVFDEVLKGFYELSRKDDVLFLGELNKKAGLLFDQEHITVEELYYRLASRFRHYLIDEFQDTSRLQWKNMELMVEEALSTGGSLFYVGDRKQAIYGFRGGQSQLFDEIKNKFQPFNIVLDVLKQNWRSQKAIVDFNNKVFDFQNLKNLVILKEEYEQEKASKKKDLTFGLNEMEELQTIFKGAKQEFQPKNTGGYVQIEYIDVDNKDERDQIIRQKVLDLVKDLSKRYCYKDIAILTRSNSQVEQMTNWLMEEGVLVESERTSNIKENHLIHELISFLQFLSSPIDNLAFSKFISGKIFQKASGLSPEAVQNFMFGIREKLRQKKDAYIYTEFRAAFPQVWQDLLEEFYKNIGLYPLYEIVVSFYHKFQCLNNFTGYQGYFMHFLEMIKRQEEEYTDIDSFLEYFEEVKGDEVYVDVSESNAIKILTIHKSKGLEFTVVIIPYLGMHIQIGVSSNDNKQSYILKEYQEEMQLIRLKTKYLQYSPTLKSLYADEYKKSFFTELNNIYVALTRPQKELYAFIPKKIKNSFNFTKFLIPEEIYKVGEPDSLLKPVVEEEKFNFLPSPQYHDWIEYLNEEFLDLNELRNRLQRVRGEIIHSLLAQLINLKDSNLDKALDQALIQTKTSFPYINNWDEYIAIVKKIVNEHLIKPFFYIDKGEVFTEKEIINSWGNTKRIDRMIVKEKEVILIDFKSGSELREEYVKQIKEYHQLVSSLYSDKKIKSYLIYFDQLKVEEIS